MDEFALLTIIGYLVTANGREIEIRLPDGRRVPSARNERMRHMAGRLSNIEYMAREIDRNDDVDALASAPGSSEGDKQFRHLLQKHKAAALVYFALRRMQRAGDVSGLRLGLAVLIAMDHGEIAEEDAVAHFWPTATGLVDEIEIRSTDLRSLPAPAGMIAAL